jgi:hypothetical protein
MSHEPMKKWREEVERERESEKEKEGYIRPAEDETTNLRLFSHFLCFTSQRMMNGCSGECKTELARLGRWTVRFRAHIIPL